MAVQPSIPQGTVAKPPNYWVRRLAQLTLFVAIMAAALFGIAGRIDWFGAWAFLIAYTLIIAVNGYFFLRQNSGLIEERASVKPGVKRWDKWIVNANTLVGMILPLVIAGLDRRFGWSQVGLGWVLVALVLFIAAYAFTSWAMYTNRFFSGYVRIQKERGHVVISTGPYQYMRHPGYVGVITSMLAIPVLLGSWWALVSAGLGAALIIFRTYLEDQTLQAELPGYLEYTRKVRYRLIPGVW